MTRSALRAAFPVLHNPANRHRAVGFTPKQFHRAFTTTLDEADSQAVYDRYHIPAPGGWVWDGALANITPGHQDTWVDYDKADRAPLLFIAGGKDQIVPRGGQQAERRALPALGRAHRLHGVRPPRPLHDRRPESGRGSPTPRAGGRSTTRR